MTHRQLRSGPVAPGVVGRSGRPGRWSLGLRLMSPCYAWFPGNPLACRLVASNYALSVFGTLEPMSSPSHCARPGCSAAPVAVLTYDYHQRTAWLDDLGGPAAGTTWVLCISHADNLRVPMGWALEDRRAEVVGLRSTRAS